MKEIKNGDGFIGGSKADLKWMKKGYGNKKGGANSAVSSLKQQVNDNVPSIGELAFNTRKYINDIKNSISNAGRPWVDSDSMGTNYLLGRAPREVLQGEELLDAPTGYTGSPYDSRLSRPPARPVENALRRALEQNVEDNAGEDAEQFLEDDIGLGKKRRMMFRKKGGNILDILEKGAEYLFPEYYFPAKWMYNGFEGNPNGDASPFTSSSVAFTRPKAPSAPPAPHRVISAVAGAKEKTSYQVELDQANKRMKDAKRRFEVELRESLADYRLQIINEFNVDVKDKANAKKLGEMVSQMKADVNNALKSTIAQASANAYQAMYVKVRERRQDWVGDKTGLGKKRKKFAKKSVKKSVAKKSVKKPTKKMSMKQTKKMSKKIAKKKSTKKMSKVKKASKKVKKSTKKKMSKKR